MSPPYRVPPPFSPLALRMAHFLEQPQVQLIYMKFSYIYLSPISFSNVAKALRDDLFTIQVMPGGLPNGAVASYSSNYNTFYFGSHEVLDDTRSRAYVLHECVHAALDYDGGENPVSNRSRVEEGAAFLAMAIHLISCGITEMQGINQTLFDVAKAAMDRKVAGKRITFTDEEVGQVLGTMISNYGYEDRQYHKNGVGVMLP